MAAHWARAAARKVGQFGEGFKRQKILDGLVEHATDLLSQFTPAGLEHFINSGLSIVEELVKTVPLDDQHEYIGQAPQYAEAAATISDADVLDGLYENLPEHVLVLRRHPTWFSAELARMRNFLFPLRPHQTRVISLDGAPAGATKSPGDGP